MGWRQKLFLTPRPSDWLPKEGEVVVLSPKCSLGNQRAIGTVVVTRSLFVLVKILYGGRTVKKVLSLDEIRPDPGKQPQS